MIWCRILGLFYSSAEESIGKEVVKCIDLARDGIHAILVVLSVRARFSKEEEAAVQSLQTFFGPKIANYMIVVFTGGDELEDDDETIEDYLGRECPESLQVILVVKLLIPLRCYFMIINAVGFTLLHVLQLAINVPSAS